MRPVGFLNHRATIASLLVTSVLLLTAQAPLPEPATDAETELGLEIYKELRTKEKSFQHRRCMMH